MASKNGNGYYDLDHGKPKAKYPYLCTSFFNLQPACPSCNRKKSDDVKKEFFPDDCAKDIGLGNEIKSVLDSMSKSSLYSADKQSTFITGRFY